MSQSQSQCVHVDCKQITKENAYICATIVMHNAQADNYNYQRTSGLASPCAVLTEVSDVEIQSIPKGVPERPTCPMLTRRVTNIVNFGYSDE
jgi:hypothetical protein